MSGSFWSYLLVLVQFGTLAAIVLTGPLFAHSPVWLLVEVAGVLLGLWAILAMRIGNFNITPIVRPTGQFVARGPYRYIRHPMYAALLLASLALVLDVYRLDRLLVWLVLLADILIKLNYEETLLDQAFVPYQEYRQRTWRLIPFVY